MNTTYRFKVHKGIAAAVFHPGQSLLVIKGACAGEDEQVAVHYSEGKVLELLLQEPGRIRSRDEILRYAWDDRVVSAGSLNQCIFNLRNLLGDDREHEIVQTVPRRGYRFNPEFLLAQDSVAPADTGSEPAPDLPQPSAAVRRGLPARPALALPGAAMRVLLPAALAAFLLMICVWWLLELAQSSPDLLDDPVGYQVHQRGGMLVNVLTSSYPAEPVLALLDGFAASGPQAASVWLLVRARSISIACFNGRGVALNAVIDRRSELEGATRALLQGCAN